MELEKVLSEGLLAIATFLVTWGAMRAQVLRLEKEMANTLEKIESIKEKYVTFVVFHDVIGELRNDQRELRSDVKSILTILNELRSSRSP